MCWSVSAFSGTIPGHFSCFQPQWISQVKSHFTTVHSSLSFSFNGLPKCSSPWIRVSTCFGATTNAAPVTFTSGTSALVMSRNCPIFWSFLCLFVGLFDCFFAFSCSCFWGSHVNPLKSGTGSLMCKLTLLVNLSGQQCRSLFSLRSCYRWTSGLCQRNWRQHRVPLGHQLRKLYIKIYILSTTYREHSFTHQARCHLHQLSDKPSKHIC